MEINPRCLLIFLLIFYSSDCFSEEPLIVSGHHDYPPFMWHEDDTVKGAGVEISGVVFRELNIPYKIKYVGPWKRVQEFARNGKIDFISGIYKNDERIDYLEFSEFYANDPVSIVVLRGNEFSCETWEDLIGKEGVTIHGDSFGKDFDLFMKERLNVVRGFNGESLFRSLEKKRADYIVWGFYTTLFNAEKYGLSSKIKVISKDFIVENIHMAFSQKSRYRNKLAEVNRIINRLKNDGTINDIIKKNMRNYRWNQ